MEHPVAHAKENEGAPGLFGLRGQLRVSPPAAQAENFQVRAPRLGKSKTGSVCIRAAIFGVQTCFLTDQLNNLPARLRR